MITWPWQWKNRALVAEALLIVAVKDNENVRAERDEALQAAADQAKRANLLTAQVREMSKR